MSLRERLNGWLSHDTHPIVQFVKYGLAGGLATATDIAGFFLLSWLVLPGLTQKDLDGIHWINLHLHLHIDIHIQQIDPHTQTVHFLMNKSLAFILSNFVAYVLNVLFVFKPGRHSKFKEFGLFYLVSGISFALGTGLATAIIAVFHPATYVAYVVNMIASLAVNYAGRKFIIFKG